VIRHLCDRVLVMYLGRIVESAPTQELFSAPVHPYTRMLLAGMPQISLERRTFTTIQGEIPSPIDPPAGCHFHPRCPHQTGDCLATRPPLEPDGRGRSVACIRWREIGRPGPEA
jgi:oligopeptide/dipeptide ABC transporter ATP-binding protein